MTNRSIIHITIDMLSIDPAIQRPLNEARTRHMVSNFNPQALGALTVSLRPDGTRVILDGQHRAAAARSAGYTGKVTAIQYEELSHEDEATLFLVLNETKQVGPIDKFRARVIAGEKQAVDMQRILSEYGWAVSRDKDLFGLSSIAAFEKVYNGSGIRRTEGDAIAANVMLVITEAWNGQVNSAHSAILSSLGKFIAFYGTGVNGIDLRKIIRELSVLKPMNFVGDIKSAKDTHKCDAANAGALLLVNLYNNKRRQGNRLDSWQTR